MRIKTFSAHVVVKKCHVVRKMAGFTHGMSNIELDVRKKRFNAHASPGITFERPARESHSKDQPGNHIRKTSPGGDGGWRRHWLPKREGTHAVGRTGGILRPRPGA